MDLKKKNSKNTQDYTKIPKGIQLNMNNQKLETHTQIEKTVADANNTYVYLQKQNTAIEQKLHEFEQVSRKHNIEIVGVEQIPGENVINDIINVSSSDIEWARRTRSPKESKKTTANYREL
ncbi:unnamed protein product [Parnassius apollo]|uniref:(apollo) hypothetical protein n=1 Tax=Parnassius apollo TaxID=110799 RepID=A0A8S3WTX7_PARAO|nr:unnamed protein product [Parnassius apollo]